MSHRPFSKDYTVYYLEGINIYGIELSISSLRINEVNFYSNNYHNDLNRYIWIFELILLIGIIMFSRYIKKLENNKTDSQKQYLSYGKYYFYSISFHFFEILYKNRLK